MTVNKNLKKFKILSYLFILFFLITVDYLITNIFVISKNKLTDNLRINHPIFHHTLKPNSKGGGVIGETYYTNSLGFRDFSKRNINNETNKKRILLMGDSATMGFFSEYENTFSGKITKYFEKKNVEVINGGVISYSPIIYFTKIKYLIDNNIKFDEVFLFIDISDPYDEVFRYELNDKGIVIDRKTVVQKSFINHLKIFISKNFIFFFKILDFVNDFFIPNADNSMFAIDHQNGLWNIKKEAYNSYGKDGLNSNIYYLDKIKKLLDTKKINMKIAIHPWPGTIYYHDKKTIYELTWENWAKDNNVKIFNAVNIFNFISDMSKKERLEVIKKYYHDLDMHFNKNGAELFFKEFKKFLENS